MAWLPNYDQGKTPAELTAGSQIHVGAIPNLQRRDPWAETLRAIAPAITSYLRQKQNAEIAAQLQAQQQQEDQQNQPLYDLQYQQEYRKAYPEQFPQGSAPNGKYAVQLPGGQTVYVTGNEAARINFKNYRGSAGDEKAKHFSESAPRTSAADINRMPPNDQPQGPVISATPQDQASSGERPISKEEYDALPVGASYIAPDGSRRVKK